MLWRQLDSYIAVCITVILYNLSESLASAYVVDDSSFADTGALIFLGLKGYALL